MPWLSPSAIAAARESMSDDRFRAEYCADFATGADRLLTPAAVQRVTADYAQMQVEGPWGPASMLGAVDWAGGLGRDRSTLVALGRPAGEEQRLAVAMAHGWHPGTPTHRVVEAIAGCRAVWARLYPESNGLGHPLSEQLIRRMRERPRELGGGARRRHILIVGPYPGGSWEEQIARHGGFAPLGGLRMSRTSRRRISPTRRS